MEEEVMMFTKEKLPVKSALIAVVLCLAVGRANAITIDFTTFPNGTPIPDETPLYDQFLSQSVIIPKQLPSTPRVKTGLGGVLISGGPTGFFGDTKIKFVGPSLPTAVTVGIIGSGLNISAELEAFSRYGVSLGTVTNTYSGTTGQLSPFTLVAPAGESIRSIRYNGGLNPSAAASIGTLTLNTSNLFPLVYPEFLFPLQSAETIFLNTESGGTSFDGIVDPFHLPQAGYFSLDFDVNTGSANVIATEAGSIVDIVTTGDYPHITIDHHNGYFTEYAEFSNDPNDFYVTMSNPEVIAGQTIGKLDADYGGRDHLHFQVKYSSDPSFFGTGLSTIEIEELHGVKVGGLFIEDYKLGSYVNPVPEPSTIMLLGSGIGLYALWSKRHKRRIEKM
jgi:murein DD-endopeptidase MepM/ murein hydrolase activator NlpD